MDRSLCTLAKMLTCRNEIRIPRLSYTVRKGLRLTAIACPTLYSLELSLKQRLSFSVTRSRLYEQSSWLSSEASQREIFDAPAFQTQSSVGDKSKYGALYIYYNEYYIVDVQYLCIKVSVLCLWLCIKRPLNSVLRNQRSSSRREFPPRLFQFISSKQVSYFLQQKNS